MSKTKIVWEKDKEEALKKFAKQYFNQLSDKKVTEIFSSITK